jgi:ribonuclease HI
VKKITIYTDGGSRGNPGSAAAGIVFYNEKGQSFKKYSQYLGENLTNNEAEYLAVILALKKFKQLFGKKISKISEVQIKSDSELLVKQLKGRYKVVDPKIQSLFLVLWNLKLDFKKIKFSFIHRDKNKEADFLVNETLDNKDKIKRLL